MNRVVILLTSLALATLARAGFRDPNEIAGTINIVQSLPRALVG